MTLEELEKIPWCFLSDEEAKERARLRELCRKKPRQPRPDTRQTPEHVIGAKWRAEDDWAEFFPSRTSL